MKETYKENLKYQDEVSEFINFSKLFKLFSRNKKIISFFTLGFFTIFCLYSLKLKRVWQGNFQIVIENKKNESLKSGIFNELPILSLLGSETTSSKNLTTQIAILKSPSVLMPIFDFVNEQKDIPKAKNSYDFEEWKKSNLKVNLLEKTSILTILYRDDNKELIEPVLKKISEAYQKYSGKNNKENLKNSLNYLDDQINKYTLKAAESLRVVQEYAIDQDLSILNNITFNDDEERYMNNESQRPKMNFLQNVDVEFVRVNAANKIKSIDKQIEKIKNVKDPKQLEYIGSIIPILSKEVLNEDLRTLEMELVNAKSKYTDDAEIIGILLNKRDLMVASLKERTIGILKAQKLAEEAKLEASIRPKEVILRYKELIRDAQRDEMTLIELENQRRQTLLLQSKKNVPWELITKPTIRNTPVAPSRKNIGALGILFGLLSGLGFSKYKENKSGFIFDNDELKNIFKIPINIVSFDENPKKNFQLLFEDLSFKKEKQALYLGLINRKNNENIFANISLDNYPNIYYLENLKNFKKNDFNILVINKSQIKYDSAKKLKSRIDLLNIEFDAIFLMN